MKYILNIPKLPQQEIDDPSIVAAALVSMKKAVNHGVVVERIQGLAETDVLMFGNVSVIAVSDSESIPERRTIERHAPLVTLHEQPTTENVIDVPAVADDVRAVEIESLKQRKGGHAGSDRGGR